MDLSKKERLILFNQYEILKELKKDDIIAVREYEKNQDILLDGYHYDYENLVSHMSEDIPDSISIWCIAIVSLLKLFIQRVERRRQAKD